MFKIIDCEQGSKEWYDARLGKPTASVFSKVVTATGKRSGSADEIVNRAVAEIITGLPDETFQFQSDDMERGKELEHQALEFFNFTKGFNFKKCGFVDSGKGYGVSPDGLEDIRGLELKCPAAHTHLAYLASEELPAKYFQQVQFQLMVTGFKTWIFGSYHPDFPCFSVEVQRDEEWIQKAWPILKECCAEIQAKVAIIREKIGAMA